MGRLIDVAERYPLAGSEARTVFELRAKGRRPAVDPAQLTLDWPVRRVNRDGLPLERVPAHRVAADAQRGGFPEENLLQLGNLRLLPEPGHHHSAPGLLHLNLPDATTHRPPPHI